MEVLFENPFIILVILGFIFSLFKKKDGGNQGHKNAHPKPVHARPIEQQKPLYSEKRNTELRPAEEKLNKHEREYLERNKQAESTMNALKEQQRLTEKRAELIQLAADNPVNEHSLPIDRKPIQSKASFSAGKQQLVDAVIWAEILGPPKARNPHRSLRRK